MNPYIDTYRNPQKIKEAFNAIKTLSKNLAKPLKIMEVCGGHTHTIMKYNEVWLAAACGREH